LNLINIGVSRCLLGDKVRYDGRGKQSRICSELLSKDFELTSICPEVEAGLSIPRPPIELVYYDDKYKVLGRDAPTLDVTEKLESFCRFKVPTLTSLSGFILTPRSPSCGLDSVPIKSQTGNLLSSNGSGVLCNR
jgi:uncharacterized protein YbbK (DUF523 family)